MHVKILYLKLVDGEIIRAYLTEEEKMREIADLWSGDLGNIWRKHNDAFWEKVEEFAKLGKKIKHTLTAKMYDNDNNLISEQVYKFLNK